MRRLECAGLVTALGLLVAGCGNDGMPAARPGDPAPTLTSQPTVSPTATRVPTQAARGTTVKAARSDYGSILFDAKGQAIYLFDKEKTSKPECYGDCAVAWPPVLTKGAPVAGTGTRAGLLGTVTRTDGSTQVTYKDHPLYFYAHEEPNEVRCHNVPGFGGQWLAVTPAGVAAPV